MARAERPRPPRPSRGRGGHRSGRVASGRIYAGLIYGIHAVRLALRQRPEAALELWVGTGVRGGGSAAALVAEARSAGVVAHRVEKAHLERLVGAVAHQGVVLRYRPPPEHPRQELLRRATAGNCFLALDRVQDPHNLGACLRVADAVGVDGLLLGAHGTAPLGATTVKTACGAAETIPVYRVSNLADTLRKLRDAGLWVIGADCAADISLFEAQWPAGIGWVLVLGGEGGGLRPVLRACCDLRARIPMAGAVESLNLGVAAGVSLFELRRRGGFPPGGRVEGSKERPKTIPRH